MLRTSVEAVPIGHVVRYRNENDYSDLVRDGAGQCAALDAPVLAFPARRRAQQYAAGLEAYYRAIDRRDFQTAATIGAELERIRRTYGDGWKNAERTRRRTRP